MQTADLVKYINDPQLLDKQSIAELQKLANDFPYFQPAHMLLSMASRKWDASVYQQSLKRTAIVVTNRDHLFNLIHAVENAEVAPPVQTPVAEIKEVVAPVKEEIKQEAVILQPDIIQAPEVVAVEASTEKLPEEQPVDVPVAEVDQPVQETPLVKENKPVLTAEELLEKEIQKQVVTSFVEKEILKTPELHHPKPKTEPENFVEWLSLLKKNNGPPLRQAEARANEEKTKVQPVAEPVVTPVITPVVKADPKKLKHRAIIDKIIESSPGLIRTKEEQKFFTPDIKAKESLLDNEHLVTETLAKIYALQGNVNKAVRAYEILSLKFPQKSAYFATLIKNLKNNQ